LYLQFSDSLKAGGGGCVQQLRIFESSP
jgi:hypothetical protein